MGQAGADWWRGVVRRAEQAQRAAATIFTVNGARVGVAGLKTRLKRALGSGVEAA